jgi:AraC-like DNA-binding protein
MGAVAYREIAPPGWLSDAIACFWVRVVSEDTEPIRVLPDACVDLIWSPGRGAWVAGPDTRPVLPAARPRTFFAGARFTPGAGGAALGLPLSELRDLRVDLADIDPGLAERLPPDLVPEDALERVAATATILVTQAPPDPAVREATRRLADPRARVDRLAGDLGFSERQLRRRFDAAVGYGPKALQRTLRFQRFLEALDAAGPRPDLARLAADAGYADQAHLSREVARLAGVTPSELRRERYPETPANTHSYPTVVILE